MVAQLVERSGVLCALLALSGCASETVEQSSATVKLEAHSTLGHAASPQSAGAEVLSGPGPWIAHTQSGTAVTLSSDDVPFHAGPITVAVEGARSIDLVSPTMPMHGVVRIAVVGGEARLEIPMEGRWALYVNLDEDGLDSAQFVFDVAAGTTGDHTHLGGS